MSNQTTKSTEFLQELKGRLSHLPISEVGKVLSYYSESIDDRIEDGMTEDEAIKSLGSIDSIVANIEEDIPLSVVVKDKITTKAKNKAGNTTNKILTILLIIVTFPLWIGLVAGAFGILIAICAVLLTIPVVGVVVYVAIAFTAVVSILYSIIAMFTVGFATGLFYFAIGLMCAGFVIMLFMPIVYCFKKILQLMLLPFKKLKKWLIRS